MVQCGLITLGPARIPPKNLAARCLTSANIITPLPFADGVSKVLQLQERFLIESHQLAVVVGCIGIISAAREGDDMINLDTRRWEWLAYAVD